ncbi:unnamed protein product [Cylindrotheca closterium]|uniref:Uncharacterized protein n=1 Tax=Cylindrotheca closterium TaxID=2856 RepID=A0AAD2CKL9_9STRA|nr:unnamed protein product [Cylindrotheca closterium]
MEVFMDDFVGMGQDHPSNPLENQRAVLSHNIDKVFQPNRPTDNQWRKEPQSQSKMAKGDASWHTVKEALGWNWGATTKTLQLKEKRVSKALALLGEVLDCKRVSLKRWQQVLGVLRSLQPGMLGSEGHFSLLQDALIWQWIVGCDQLLATVQDADRRDLLDDIRAVELGIECGVCPSRVAKAHSVWTTWVAFCNSLTLDPGLSTVDDPLLIILLFGTQWRRGKIAPSKRQAQGRTAEDAMRQVGQTISSLGLLDPRMNRYAPGTMDFRWTRLLKSWKKADPAAQRVRPLLKALLRQASKLAKNPPVPMPQRL